MFAYRQRILLLIFLILALSFGNSIVFADCEDSAEGCAPASEGSTEDVAAVETAVPEPSAEDAAPVEERAPVDEGNAAPAEESAPAEQAAAPASAPVQNDGGSPVQNLDPCTFPAGNYAGNGNDNCA